MKSGAGNAQLATTGTPVRRQLAKRMASPKRANSPPRRTGSPNKKFDMSVDQLVEKLDELEKHKIEDERAKKKEETQHKRDMTAAKKKLAREIQSTKGNVRKRSMEVGKLQQQLHKVETRKLDSAQKKTTTASRLDELIQKAEAQHNSVEEQLQAKIGDVGEAKGTLAYLESAKELLDQGILLPFDSTTALQAARDGRVRAIAGGIEGLGDDDVPVVPAAQERQSGMRTRQDEGEAKLLRGELGQIRDENTMLRQQLEQASGTAKSQDARMETLRNGLQTATDMLKNKIKRIEELTDNVSFPSQGDQANALLAKHPPLNGISAPAVSSTPSFLSVGIPAVARSPNSGTVLARDQPEILLHPGSGDEDSGLWGSNSSLYASGAEGRPGNDIISQQALASSREEPHHTRVAGLADTDFASSPVAVAPDLMMLSVARTQVPFINNSSNHDPSMTSADTPNDDPRGSLSIHTANSEDDYNDNGEVMATPRVLFAPAIPSGTPGVQPSSLSNAAAHRREDAVYPATSACSTYAPMASTGSWTSRRSCSLSRPSQGAGAMVCSASLQRPSAIGAMVRSFSSERPSVCQSRLGGAVVHGVSLEQQHVLQPSIAGATVRGLPSERVSAPISARSTYAALPSAHQNLTTSRLASPPFASNAVFPLPMRVPLPPARFPANMSTMAPVSLYPAPAAATAAFRSGVASCSAPLGRTVEEVAYLSALAPARSATPSRAPVYAVATSARRSPSADMTVPISINSSGAHTAGRSLTPSPASASFANPRPASGIATPVSWGADSSAFPYASSAPLVSAGAPGMVWEAVARPS